MGLVAISVFTILVGSIVLLLVSAGMPGAAAETRLILTVPDFFSISVLQALAMGPFLLQAVHLRDLPFSEH